MTDFSKVTPGTPSNRSPARSAAWLNAVSETAQHYQERIAGGVSSGGDSSLKSSSGLVKVRNLVGAGEAVMLQGVFSPLTITQGFGSGIVGVDLLRGHYVQLGERLLAAVDHRHLWFEGNLYDASSGRQIAIITKALKNTEIGPARTMGVCTALVNVTDVGHGFAATVEGGYVFTSATSGPVRILSPLSATGEQEVEVLLGGGETFQPQLAVVTEAGTSANSVFGADSDTLDDFQDDFYLSLGPVIRCLLLESAAEGAHEDSPVASKLLQVKAPPADHTIEEMEFTAHSAYHDQVITKGMIVEVWRRSGVRIDPPGDAKAAADTHDEDTIFARLWSATDELRGVAGFDGDDTESPRQMLIKQADSDALEWESLPSGEALTCEDVLSCLDGQLPVWIFNPELPQPTDTYGEGYCIDLDAVNDLIHHDAITEAAGVPALNRELQEFQFWHHLPLVETEEVRTDAKWNTVADYASGADQMWWHRSGDFEFKTTADYVEEEDVHQLLVNVEGDWKWAELACGLIYVDGKLQPDLPAIVGLKDETTFKSLDSCSLSIVEGQLKLEIHYKIFEVELETVVGEEEECDTLRVKLTETGTDSTQCSVSVDGLVAAADLNALACDAFTPIEIPADVECIEGEIVVTTTTIRVPTCEEP